MDPCWGRRISSSCSWVPSGISFQFSCRTGSGGGWSNPGRCRRVWVHTGARVVSSYGVGREVWVHTIAHVVSSDGAGHGVWVHTGACVVFSYIAGHLCLSGKLEGGSFHHLSVLPHLIYAGPPWMLPFNCFSHHGQRWCSVVHVCLFWKRILCCFI